MPIKKKLEESNKNLTATTTMTRRDRFIKNVDLTALLETFGTNVVTLEAESSFLYNEEINERVKMAIQNVKKDYSFTFENQDKSFIQVLFGFDSLDFLEIIQSVESEFKIDIPDDIMDSLDTFNKIVDYIRIRKLSPFYFKEKEFRIQRDSNPSDLDLSSWATDTTKFLTINDPDIIKGKIETGYYPFNYKIENIPGVNPIRLNQAFNGFSVTIPQNVPVGCKLTISRVGFETQTTSANFIWDR